MWLRAARTNSDPKVIGGYFVETLERCGGCPRLVRTDMGTENVVVRDIQRYLRRDDVDDRAAERSYVTGASTANQRIESWWGVMRKQGIEPWITAVGELKDEGFFSGDFVDKALSQFCFMSIIQELLNDIQGVWNAHRIRPSKNPNVPSGIPDVMQSRKTPLPSPCSSSPFVLQEKIVVQKVLGLKHLPPLQALEETVTDPLFQKVHHPPFLEWPFQELADHPMILNSLILVSEIYF
ncbi:hypothetical protein D5F01_LYC01366 [Larimichthys crocea]|nr:hypothetical protein D5F01_LYC14870 [Larimichthys crocea]KAE8289575.1 hypothetical protein D5F01_LYC11279 [Larimichthys crocea]KAE8298984.1 hypothetical protein D5F01_LYC01366 [Larimichthys crocea]